MKPWSHIYNMIPDLDNKNVKSWVDWMDHLACQDPLHEPVDYIQWDNGDVEEVPLTLKFPDWYRDGKMPGKYRALATPVKRVNNPSNHEYDGDTDVNEEEWRQFMSTDFE